MGNRLSKIYTRTGDAGTTGLGDGSRVPKDHARVVAYGTVDELNSAIGLLLGQADVPARVADPLSVVQHQLFDCGSELCVPGYEVLSQDYIDFLEQTLDALNADLPYLKEFILPGGSAAAGACHMARTVCRRAEREVIALGREAELPPLVPAYLNRLSDLLFVMSRVILIDNGLPEVLWRPGELRNPSAKPQ